MKVVRLSVLSVGRLYLQFLLESESTPGPESIKNYKDTIGSRTCDLPACSAVPQPISPLHHASISICTFKKIVYYCFFFNISNFPLLNCVLVSNTRLKILILLIRPQKSSTIVFFKISNFPLLNCVLVSNTRLKILIPLIRPQKSSTIVFFKISNFPLLNCVLVSNTRLKILFPLIHPVF